MQYLDAKVAYMLKFICDTLPLYYINYVKLVFSHVSGIVKHLRAFDLPE